MSTLQIDQGNFTADRDQGSLSIAWNPENFQFGGIKLTEMDVSLNGTAGLAVSGKGSYTTLVKGLTGPIGTVPVIGTKLGNLLIDLGLSGDFAMNVVAGSATLTFSNNRFEFDNEHQSLPDIPLTLPIAEFDNLWDHFKDAIQSDHFSAVAKLYYDYITVSFSRWRDLYRKGVVVTGSDTGYYNFSVDEPFELAVKDIGLTLGTAHVKTSFTGGFALSTTLEFDCRMSALGVTHVTEHNAIMPPNLAITKLTCFGIVDTPRSSYLVE